MSCEIVMGIQTTNTSGMYSSRMMYRVCLPAMNQNRPIGPKLAPQAHSTYSDTNIYRPRNHVPIRHSVSKARFNIQIMNDRIFSASGLAAFFSAPNCSSHPQFEPRQNPTAGSEKDPSTPIRLRFPHLSRTWESMEFLGCNLGPWGSCFGPAFVWVPMAAATSLLVQADDKPVPGDKY